VPVTHTLLSKRNKQWNFRFKLINLDFDWLGYLQNICKFSLGKKAADSCQQTLGFFNESFSSNGINWLELIFHPGSRVLKPLVCCNPKVGIGREVSGHGLYLPIVSRL
jgi:hypothetical protein